MLDSLITSKTRQKLLVKFFSNPKNMGHLRGLAEEFGESTNSIRKELNNLAEAGLLIKSEDKNRVDYQANPDHAFFTNLQDLIQKVEANRNYRKSDTLQVIRILKNYDLLKDAQMDLEPRR